jgi:hypothetical protein
MVLMRFSGALLAMVCGLAVLESTACGGKLLAQAEGDDAGPWTGDDGDASVVFPPHGDAKPDAGLGEPPALPDASSPPSQTVLSSAELAPVSIGLNDANVVWLDQGSPPRWYDGMVTAMPLDGGAPRTIAANLKLAGQLAVRGDRVYWTTQLGGTVASASIDGGGGAPVALASGQYDAYAIAVDGHDVYWTILAPASGGGSVWSVPVGGGTPVLLAAAQEVPRGIAVDATSVYWTDDPPVADSGTVMRMPLGGGAITTLASGQNRVGAIAVDESSVYWLASDAVMKAPLSGAPDGGAAVALYRTQGQNEFIGVDGAATIRVDAHDVYWTNGNASPGRVMSVAKSGGEARELVSQQMQPTGLALAPAGSPSASAVYWTDEGSSQNRQSGGVLMEPLP